MRQALVLLALDELDAVVDQVRREVFDLLLRELDFLDPLDDLVIGEEPLLLSRRDELLQLFDVGKSNVDSEHLSTTSGYAWVDGENNRQRKEPALCSISGSPSDGADYTSGFAEEG